MKPILNLLSSILLLSASAQAQSFLDAGWMAQFRPPTPPAGGGGGITLDGTSTNVVTDTAESTVTWSHTITNTLAGGYVIVGWDGWTASTPQQPTGITFDGSAMSSLGAVTTGDGARVSMWGLALGNKAAGTYNIVSTQNHNSYQVACSASVWTGVNQSTPIGTPATATGSSTTPSVNVSSATGEVVVDVMGSYNGAATVGANQTLRVAAIGAGENEDCHMSSEAGAATVTMSWTITSHPWGIIAVPLKP